jgi:hypothetical protein
VAASHPLKDANAFVISSCEAKGGSSTAKAGVDTFIAASNIAA